MWLRWDQSGPTFNVGTALLYLLDGFEILRTVILFANMVVLIGITVSSRQLGFVYSYREGNHVQDRTPYSVFLDILFFYTFNNKYWILCYRGM